MSSSLPSLMPYSSPEHQTEVIVGILFIGRVRHGGQRNRVPRKAHCRAKAWPTDDSHHCTEERAGKQRCGRGGGVGEVEQLKVAHRLMCQVLGIGPHVVHVRAVELRTG